MPLPFLIIPAALILSIKAFFLAHGLTIGMSAIKAGYKAHKNGDDVVEAAVSAGASTAAAILLRDSLRRYC